MTIQKTVGITGAGGTLGKALTIKFKTKGYKVIGFTHNKTIKDHGEEGPNKWVYWECGKEYLLEKDLKDIDILILNHGIYQSNITGQKLENIIEINALSKYKILNLFEKISIEENKPFSREIWINTSEAEIFPALNPTYEISKSLIGKLITFKKNFNSKNLSEKLIIRKIILGPFKSELNPIGIMSSDFVAFMIYYLANLNSFLIIVSPNPLTYIIFPLMELYYFLYYRFLKILKLIY